MLRGFPALQRPVRVHTPQTKVRCGGWGACSAALAQRGRRDLSGDKPLPPGPNCVTACLSPIHQQPHIAAAGLPAHRGDPKPTPG